MFSWFDTREAKEFGARMAHAFAKQIPLGKPQTDKKFTSKSRQALTVIEREAANFKRTQRLNTYKIAQAGNTFKWALLDAGYDRVYVDELTAWLVGKLR